MSIGFNRGVFLALAAGVVFSFGSITVRITPHLDSIQYLFWRNVGMLPMFVAIALLLGRSPLRQLMASGWLGLLGAICLTIVGNVGIYAMKTTTIANATLFSSAAPLCSAILAWLILKEKIQAITWAGIAVGIVGLLIMTWGELGSGDAVGNLAAFSVGVVYAFYSVIAKLGSGRDMSGVIIGWALLTLVLNGAFLLVSGSSFATPSSENSAAMFHGAVLIFGGMVLLNHAARHVGAGQLILLAQTETVLAPVWVFLAFSETPRLSTVLGGGVLLGGVLLSAMARRPARQEVIAVGAG